MEPTQRQPPARVAHQKTVTKADSFILKAVPDIPEDSVILGVCHVDLEFSSHGKDGWRLADMLAFNYLKTASNSQTWLCGASETDIFEKHGEYVHGNAHNVRKIVLSQDIFDNNEITPFTVVSQQEIKTRVLQEIQTGCAYAKANQKHLMLFFFAHVRPRFYSIRLDPRNMHPSSSVLDLSLDEVIPLLDPSVPTTVTTACCHSGGWTVNPALNATVIAGSSPEKETWTWPQAESVRNRIGGTVFSSAIIKTLCDETSPLLDGESQMSGLSTNNPIQPENPTENQVRTYNAFLRKTNRVLKKTLRHRSSMSSISRHRMMSGNRHG
jgi:hypothetical protein